MQRWEDVERYVTEEAERDLTAGADMARPCLLAFTGEDPCFVAFLRPFVKGAYHDPLVELLALAASLGADRLAFAVTARAWSLDDPIPPVVGDVDLRQRVLMVERVDEAGHRSVLLPFDDPVPGEAIRWRPRRELPGSEGWIASALTLAASPEARARMASTDEEVAEQARRCVELGHLLAWPPAVADRLAAAQGSAVRSSGARSGPSRRHRLRTGRP